MEPGGKYFKQKQMTAAEHKKIQDEQNPALRIQVYSPFMRRLWNLIRNPFTYLIHGRIEW